MNAETPTTPTIAELWREFEPMTITGNPCYIHSREGEQWSSMFRSLRAQLIERCKRVPDKSGYYTSFGFIGGSLHSQFRNTLGQIVLQSRHDNSETTKEYASACAFLTWEFEQRKKEAQP